MHVLFSVSDWPGHWFPLVPLGWALQGAGHEVRVVCARSQADGIARTGLTPVPVVEPGLEMSVQARMRNFWDAQQGGWPFDTPPPHPVTGEEMTALSDFDFAAFRATQRPRILQATADGFDAVVGFARAWRPDLVVHDRMSIEGLLAARVLGVPAVLHLWGPHGTAEPEPELRIVPGDPTGSFPRHGAGRMGPDQIEYVVDPCPAGIEPPVHATRLPVRYVPYNGPGPDPRLEPPGVGRPRVCVIWGNSPGRIYGRPGRLLPELAAAFAGLDAELVLVGGSADLKDLQPAAQDMRVLTDVPLRLVLPGCDAVVHHGGAGALMTAVAAGVPQLGVPFAPEQVVNVRRLTDAGAGLSVPAHQSGLRETVRDRLGRLLTEPAHATAARRLRDQLAARPSPADLVVRLEKLAAGAAHP